MLNIREKINFRGYHVLIFLAARKRTKDTAKLRYFLFTKVSSLKYYIGL